MKTISSGDLKEILRKHALWVYGDPEGERADLTGADLTGADLTGADLKWTKLVEADLYRADLSGADLSEANLYRADLSGADLREANLSGADLYGANLYKANLYKANLYRADLSGADLSEAKIDWPLVCPEKGSFIGYKKCRGGLIVELEIPEDALRSSATTRKCRCSKAKVLSITNLDGSATDISTACSKYDSTFTYKIGETVEVPNFDTNRWNGCSTGIHFFIGRQEAVEYC